MRLQKVADNKLKRRAFELALTVGNVITGRDTGIITDMTATEILFDLAEKNEDLVLQEHANPEVKEAMRKIRITLLPFSRRPFAT